MIIKHNDNDNHNHIHNDNLLLVSVMPIIKLIIFTLYQLIKLINSIKKT